MLNVTLGIMQLLSIIGISIYEFSKKSLSIFLWATLLVMFGIPHTMSIIIGTEGYSDDTMIKASIFVILFNFIYIVSKFILYSSFSKNSKLQLYSLKEMLENKNKRMAKLSFLLLFSSFIILIFYSIKYGGGIFNISWGKIRNINIELGFRSLLRYGELIFFSSAGVALVFLSFKKKFMTMISFMIIIFYSLLTGNRITILPALITVIIPYVLSEEKKLTFKQMAIFILLGFFTIYVVYLLRFIRIYGGVYNLVSNASLSSLNFQIWEMMLSGEGELGLKKAFYHFIQHDNNFTNFNKGHTYIRLLLIAIPTFILKGIKPTDFGISMGSAWSMNPYNTSYSMHPTLYGDCFANLWWFGILLGIFWAILLYLIDKFINKKNAIVKIMLTVLFGVVYVIVGRGSVYNGLFIAFIGTIIILIINLVSKIKL